MLPRSKSRETYRVLSGHCPDQNCRAKLFFPAWDSSIECTDCGQRHQQSAIQDVEEVTNPDVALHNMLRNVLLSNTKPKKGADTVRVLGLSNYQCKLLSPLLSHYGMDKQSGKAKRLRDMNQPDTFDCVLLGDRAFQIAPEHVEIVGYGRDRSGSMQYLHDTLDAMKKVNDKEERLIPIHADGDGHCLVHAISRALVGRELFWHALRENLKAHFIKNLDQYKALFHDFIDSSEWDDIIEECDPDFTPRDGEPLGLRNIHVFGLANVLHRPIILLDSLEGLQSSADYCGTFVPGLIPPEKCKGKDGTLNKPLCLAWSSSGRNHYISLVGIRGRPLCKLPMWLIPKLWGVPQDLLTKYVEFDSDQRCAIGGSRSLPETYIQRLARAMEDVFMEKYQVHPSVVSDMHHYVFKRTGVVGVQPEVVTEATQSAIRNERLYRCLTCDAVMEYSVGSDLLKRGGTLYQLAVRTHGKLQVGKNYHFPLQSLICKYDPVKDILVPDMKMSRLTTCSWCQGTSVRLVCPDGSVVYLNGDRTHTAAENSQCGCGFKHYWDGKEYDNLPELIPVTLEWGGKTIQEKVYWFQYETDTSLNSNVYEVATELVHKHFPGEFGSERLVKCVVDLILQQTAKKEVYKPVSLEGMPGHEREGEPRQHAALDPSSPSKIILTGHKHKTIHKEELTMSEAERMVQRKITDKAAHQQKKKSDEMAKRRAEKELKQLKQQQATAHQQSKPVAKVGPMVTTPPPRPSTPPTEKKVRVTTSEGKQVMLTLAISTTFPELQARIASELGVPDDRQRIRYGFPPRPLAPPKPGMEGEPVPLQHGDKVTVDILPPPKGEGQEEGAEAAAKGVPMAVAGSPRRVQGMEAGGASASQDPESALRDQLMNVLDQQLESNASSIDLQISSLSALAMLSGKDLWSFVQTMPQLFSREGVFTKKVEQDLGLSDGKHCTLPSFPGKTFMFNDQAGRLELCLEPQGHFPIGPGIDDVIAQNKQTQEPYDPKAFKHVKEALHVGGSGVIVSKSEVLKVRAFAGKGQTLGGTSQPQPSTSTATDVPANAAVFIPDVVQTQSSTEGAILQPPGDTKPQPVAMEEDDYFLVESAEEDEGEEETSDKDDSLSTMKKAPGVTVIGSGAAAAVMTTEQEALMAKFASTASAAMQAEQEVKEQEEEIKDSDGFRKVEIVIEDSKEHAVAMETDRQEATGDDGKSKQLEEHSGNVSEEVLKVSETPEEHKPKTTEATESAGTDRSRTEGKTSEVDQARAQNVVLEDHTSQGTEANNAQEKVAVVEAVRTETEMMDTSAAENTGGGAGDKLESSPEHVAVDVPTQGVHRSGPVSEVAEARDSGDQKEPEKKDSPMEVEPGKQAAQVGDGRMAGEGKEDAGEAMDSS
ncbi:deubiquitinating protein VCPIP1-like [Branchiostoma lanceolatum]|uniref:deubiquitinating protein VCPIP1-like n=1 Tax=Branchiostoma lanceolatum TaxID=7740 RepID=UPI0034573255